MAKYSKEFKREAIKLSDEIGIKQAAAQLGLPYYTLADWRHRTRDRIESDIPVGKKKEQSLTKSEIRIRELERENSELRNANNILKDALGFFVQDRKK